MGEGEGGVGNLIGGKEKEKREREKEEGNEGEEGQEIELKQGA
jgi:hypothetical protein